MADIKAIKGTDDTTYSIVDRFSEWGGYNLLKLTSENINYNDYTNSLRDWALTNTYAPHTISGNTATSTRNGSGLTNKTSGIRFACVTSSGALASSNAGQSTNFGIEMSLGDVFTYSVDIQTTGNIVRLTPQYWNGSSVWSEPSEVYGSSEGTATGGGTVTYNVTDTNWHRYYITFVLPNNFICFTAIANGCENTEGITISAKNWKLERGHKATDWSPCWTNIFTYDNETITMNI